MDRPTLLKEAAEHVRKSRFTKAIECFRTVLAEDPQDVDVRAKLAEAYRRSGNTERAFHHFQRAATILAGRRDYRKAFPLLKAANELAPNEPDILFRLAECSKALGLGQELEASLVKIVAVARAEKDRRRLWALEQLVALRPGDLALAEQHAEALAEAGMPQPAVLTFRAIAMRCGPRSDHYPRLLSRAAVVAKGQPALGVAVVRELHAAEWHRAALAALVPFYEAHPDDTGVLETLVSILDAIGAQPKSVAARMELIKARAVKGQGEECVRDIEALLRSAPADPQALEVAGHAATAVGKAKLAATIWRRLARIADERGLRFERDRAILGLLHTAPDDEEALELGARALLEAGKTSEAQEFERRLEQIRAKNASRSGESMVVPADSEPDVLGGSEAVLLDAKEAPVTGGTLRTPSEIRPAERLPIARNPFHGRSPTTMQGAGAVPAGFEGRSEEAPTAPNRTVEEPMGAEEITSKIQALVSSEGRKSEAGTQPTLEGLREELIADLLDDVDPRR